LLDPELRRILDIELGQVRWRVQGVLSVDFGLVLTGEAKDFLLAEGTDKKHGARHLRRAIERLLVQPIARLLRTGQLERGDRVEVGSVLAA
jgi:ATP-dependent Clp protease ATP-binding subunit ClpB